MAEEGSEWALLKAQELDLDDVATPNWVKDTDLLVAQGLPNVPGGAVKALVQVEGQAIRWKPSAATGEVTATDGMLIPANSQLVFIGGLANIRIIQVAPSATVQVVYFK